MRSGLLLLIGVLPSMLLSAGALFLLYVGFYGLFDRPASSAALIAWSGAGLTGTWALISAWSGRWTENTAPLLALGVVATIRSSSPQYYRPTALSRCSGCCFPPVRSPPRCY